MTKFIVFVTTFLLWVTTCFKQDTNRDALTYGKDFPDTIKVEPSFYYPRDKDPHWGKAKAARLASLTRAREDIVFSPTYKRIEYCYYYDNYRNCYGTTYQITSDSTLDVWDDDWEVWHYKKQGNTYFIEQYYDNTYICGFTKSLIPLEFVGLSITTTVDKIDTLWIIDHSVDYSPLTLHKTKVKGTIYTKDKVDSPPTLLNGDTLKIIYGSTNGIPKSVCPSLPPPPPPPTDKVTFVVTKEGRIVNIENSYAESELDYCPSLMTDLIRSLIQFGQIKPATLNGQNVNVQWTL
ncbi:hypothetical protein [Xanthocytophaga agilis]|uniref:Uncharacterized protein n=1 Tax=Xanthocytophaga agilis TaxID=3048010 RepID=A0AAE3UKA4_9BACT|nr:hypothetical protein [Xanthocytophaga agilis]MDJ1506808.1 hypothetical protein [Xanthocytophaga agilis]